MVSVQPESRGEDAGSHRGGCFTPEPKRRRDDAEDDQEGQGNADDRQQEKPRERW